jgi:hypothetical protein
MARTKILIDYDIATHEIRRIIHIDDDDEIVHHYEEPGWKRLVVDRERALGLKACCDEVERITGRRPPHA